MVSIDKLKYFAQFLYGGLSHVSSGFVFVLGEKTLEELLHQLQIESSQLLMVPACLIASK